MHLNLINQGYCKQNDAHYKYKSQNIHSEIIEWEKDELFNCSPKPEQSISGKKHFSQISGMKLHRE